MKCKIVYWENSFLESKKHFYYIRSKKKFLWIKENFVNSKKFDLIQKNRFVYIKEHFFESTKLSLIQRNFFFDHISKKLFSGCLLKKSTNFFFLKANRAFSRLNFLFHLKSKDLVTLWKCNSHLPYYKIDLSFNIKLQEINLYACEEYKIEREIQIVRSAKCNVQICIKL